MASEELSAKILIVGDSTVGKTSILAQFTEGRFYETMLPTLGIDFKTKKMKIENTEVKLQIWDTAGQEKYRSIAQNFFKGSKAILFVFDLTDSNSLEGVEQWLKNFLITELPPQTTALIGNKCDLVTQRAITREQAITFAKLHNIQYFETSAKTGENVQELFNTITLDLWNKFLKEQAHQYNSKKNSLDPIPSDSQTSSLKKSLITPRNSEKPKTKSGCCSQIINFIVF